jgi:hypothetical protein
MKKSFAVVAVLFVMSLTASGQNPALQGFLDNANCQTISGWAADTLRLNTPLTVRLFTDGVFSRSVVANIARPDVATVLGDNGLHGFVFQVPVGVMDNQPHTIKVTFDDGIKELTNSPKSVTCTPPSLVAVGGGQPTGLQITSFDVRPRFATLKLLNQNTTDSTVRVVAQFDQTPAFFRLAEVSNINNAAQELRGVAWKPYTDGMTLTFRLDTSRPYGVRNVFMQINNQQSENGASPPKGDSITFAPVSTKDFVLTGNALADFISRAKSLGYKFSMSGPIVTGNSPCFGASVENYTLLQRPVTDTSQNFSESASGVIFSKPGESAFLNPFWKVREIKMGDIFPRDLQTLRVNGPLSGRVDDLSRSVSWSAAFSRLPDVSIVCVKKEFVDPPFTSITIEGPSDRPATDAFRSPN